MPDSPRSQSLVSSFFNKDGSLSFFNAENHTSSDNSIHDFSSNSLVDAEPPSASDLDIVGTLGTLNLDEELEDLPKPAPQSSISKSTSNSISHSSASHSHPQEDVLTKSATTMVLQPLVSNIVAPQILPGVSSMGSLTPNPSLVSSFSGPSANANIHSSGPMAPPMPTVSTPNPSAPWNNTFVPFSAPPFAFPMSEPNPDLAMLVPPLELPESKSNHSMATNAATAANASPQPMHPFGGMLDSRYAFGNFYSVPGFDSLRNQPKSDFVSPSPADGASGSNASGPISGSDIQTKRSAPAERVMPSVDPSMPEFLASQQQMGIHSMWNQPHLSFINPQFVPNRPLPHPQAMDMMPDPLAPFGHPAPPPPQQSSFMRPGSIPPNINGMGDYYNRFQDSNQSEGSMQSMNGLNSSQANGFAGNNNRRPHFMNSGVNVHRKMHNSHRRKGEDASKYVNAKLEDFSGIFYTLCKDQHGCRFLQRQLDLGKEAAGKKKAGERCEVLTNDVAATMIFNEIYLKVVELMVDPFGNYLIQKLLENLSSDQRLVLVKNAAPDFIRIALDPHGTRALQKLVECISTQEETQLIIDNLSPHVVSLSRDLNGNHVVQKCLQKFDPPNNQFIFDTASSHCNQIATHRHGCCVLQRCLDYGNKAQRKQLSLKVAENATNLSLDPFGNYVVQYVLSRGDDRSIEIIMEHIKPNIIQLSLHKFGSNVIEKSLRIPPLTDQVMEVLLNCSDEFGLLINDPFGNYVLQTSLDVAKSENLAKLAVRLQPLLPSIKSTPHGRRIMTKIQNIL